MKGVPGWLRSRERPAVAPFQEGLARMRQSHASCPAASFVVVKGSDKRGIDWVRLDGSRTGFARRAT